MMTQNAKRNCPDARISYVGLGSFINECITAQNLHYYSVEELLSRYPRIVDEYLGTLEKDGHLQNDLNRSHNNIFNDLQDDFPHFTRKRRLAFSYIAARLPVSLIVKRIDISCESAFYTMKSLMKNEIEGKKCARRDDYLDLLKR